MHIAEIISIIEQMAPLQGAASWDVSGLQVAAQLVDQPVQLVLHHGGGNGNGHGLRHLADQVIGELLGGLGLLFLHRHRRSLLIHILLSAYYTSVHCLLLHLHL